MKRILIINKFYYPRGGDCTATLSLEQLLQSRGHAVAIFSTRHPQNNFSAWSSYFPAEISFSAGGLKSKLHAASRLFYPKDVKQQFIRLLDKFQPDVIHAHNIHSYISPYVLEIAHRRGIKVVWTLHDYKLICPSYNCLREGKPCELCYTNNHFVLTKKCMKNSFAASTLAYLEALVWNRSKLQRYTDVFISPSHFLKSKMIQAGFEENKIQVLHNFINIPSQDIGTQKKNYYCYVGRLSPEKGIEDLLTVANQLPYPLKIVGNGVLLDFYKKKYAAAHIDFLGYQPSDKVLEIVKHANFSVIPSIWYENNPFSLIESQCVGTPVLGASIGGIPELVKCKKDGDLFESGNREELKNKIIECFRLFNDNFNFASIAEEARIRFSAKSYYDKIKDIYGY